MKLENLLSDEQIAQLNNLGKPKRRRMTSVMVSSGEDRFLRIKQEIKEQDRRLREMGIEVSTPKTIHYFVSVCGVERELTHTKYLEFKALGAKAYTKLL